MNEKTIIPISNKTLRAAGVSFWTRGVAMPADEGRSMDFMQANDTAKRPDRERASVTRGPLERLVRRGR